ncbi:type I iodothyronine deiodinase-like [Glandiceps talaboti]
MATTLSNFLPRVYFQTFIKAIVHSGSLMKLYQEYKDRVDFIMVYMREMHPMGTIQDRGSNISLVEQHHTLDDRIEAANLLIELDTKYQTFSSDVTNSSKVPIVLDNMADDFKTIFAAMPDRVVVIENNRLAFIGYRVEEQVQEGLLMTDELRTWFCKRFSNTY